MNESQKPTIQDLDVHLRIEAQEKVRSYEYFMDALPGAIRDAQVKLSDVQEMVEEI